MSMQTLRRFAMFGITMGTLTTEPILVTPSLCGTYFCSDVINDNVALRIVKGASSPMAFYVNEERKM